jgi:hypothetical protein
MVEPDVVNPIPLSGLQYVQYEPAKEQQYLPSIRQLISKDLSEPYSIYVYRYFLYQWGDLCYMVTFPSSSSQEFLLRGTLQIGPRPIHIFPNRRYNLQT